MKEELRYGKLRYVSFITLNIFCLITSNLLAYWVYIYKKELWYRLDEYRPVIIIMVFVDIIVTLVFNTLVMVLRRRIQKEIIENIKHVGISFVTLAVILFCLRSGAKYSRITVFLSYCIDFLLITITHLLWRGILWIFRHKSKSPTALLMTTDRFVDEGLEELWDMNIDIKHIFLLKNINRDVIKSISVLKTYRQVVSAISWKWIDRVYIYGLDHQMIPEYLIRACRDMKLNFDLVDFKYRVIDVKTIQNEDPKYGALSFLEGKRDIPFPIRRVYWITETEADLHRGFHAHKLNCQLLYCPYGKIDIIVDDGIQKAVITLDKPGKGLILMPGLWREMVWQQTGSVLCVLASEYYDAQEYIRDYEEFVAYNKSYRNKNQGDK